ncbi:MAG: DUF58 domain-containing protein, partial [Chitinophagaceae bacterium]
MLKSFHLNNIVYYIAGASAVIFVLSYFEPGLFRIATLVLLLLGIAIVVDTLLVYSNPKGIHAQRITTDRFSIGDPNKVSLLFRNRFSFPVRLSVIDELPVQFQERDWLRKTKIDSGTEHVIDYFLHPTSRGEYIFEDINVFVHAPFQLVRRRFVFKAHHTVKVYPSYIQMRRYHLLAVSNRLQEAGVKR